MMAKMLLRGALCLALLTGVVISGCAWQREREAAKQFERARQELYPGPIQADVQQRPEGEFSADPVLADYLAYAAAHNPELQAAFERWRAALETVTPSKTLPDPKFTYRFFIQEVETRVGPQEQSFGLAQKFPWFGKLDLRGDIAVAKSQVQGQVFEAAKLKLFYQVKDAYYEYYYLGRAIAVTEENIKLMNYLERVARTKYKAAAAGHQDVIRAQVEQGKLADRLRGLQDLRNPIMARLNAALNRPAGVQLPWPAEQLQEEKIQASDQQIFSWLVQANPQLKALEHQITAEKQGIKLAGKDYFPDITLGVDYIDTGGALMAGVSDSGKDPVVVMASVNLPIWHDKYRANQRRARARYLAAIRDRLGTENALASQLHLSLYEFRDARRKIDLYRDTLIPKAEQSLKTTQTAFMANRANFLDLIDSERILLEFQLSYERALASHAQRLAQLEMLVGRELPRVIVQPLPQPQEQPEPQGIEQKLD